MRDHLAILFTAALLVLASVIPASSLAYGLAGGGGKLGYASPEDLDGALMVGGHLEFAEQGTRIHLLPNMTFWKADRVSDLNTNLDLYYHFKRPGSVTPYVGGGVGLNHVNYQIADRSETDLGANVFGGFRFPNGSQHYFLEGRYTASDLPQVSVLAGVTFSGR